MNNRSRYASIDIPTQNRELAWLSFNERVLEEADDESVPPLERLRFLDIFSRNLDEFFMVRVGRLLALREQDPAWVDPRSGMIAPRLLSRIFGRVRAMYAARDAVFFRWEQDVHRYGAVPLTVSELTAQEDEQVRRYVSHLFPLLTPRWLAQGEGARFGAGFPDPANRALQVGVVLEVGGRWELAVVPVPKIVLPPPDMDCLPQTLLFTQAESLRFLGLAQTLAARAELLFPHTPVRERFVFRVTRYTDMLPFLAAPIAPQPRIAVADALERQTLLPPVRLEISDGTDTPERAWAIQQLRKRLGLSPKQVFGSVAPLALPDTEAFIRRFSALSKRPSLVYPVFRPQPPADLADDRPLIPQILQRDRLLCFPQERFDTFLRLIQEAVADPAVVSIQMTVYRLAPQARLAELLCHAARCGKQVRVVVELRARGDERRNLGWAARLENAGCTVVYGLPAYKVHAKVCLITRLTPQGLCRITQVGTGNYHEATVTAYTDLSLLTADADIGEDAALLFDRLAEGRTGNEYRRLLVSPHGLKAALLAEMEREIAKGQDGRILVKVNALTDRDLMAGLCRASCAGVPVRLMVRGSCCLLPDVPGATEHVQVIRLVGRFLEHSRVYAFGEGDGERIYLSSADWMTRNTERRVEVACPVTNHALRRRLRTLLEQAWQDRDKAQIMRSDGSYRRLGEQDKIKDPETG